MLALASAFVAVPALGANRDAKEKAARTACLAGDYAKGVTLLSELFVETKDPNWIFPRDALSRMPAFRKRFLVSKSIYG
jgi:hypothetical protein